MCVFTPVPIPYSSVSVDLNSNNPGPSLNDASVQTSEPETVTPSAEDDAPKTITCMLCQEEVPRDKKSLRAHVQTHSGKRYGCSRCKYHTDRKFDVCPSFQFRSLSQVVSYQFTPRIRACTSCAVLTLWPLPIIACTL
ncbi:hypothetical protein COOONC_19683 [Cooperia oncophora]